MSEPVDPVVGQPSTASMRENLFKLIDGVKFEIVNYVEVLCTKNDQLEKWRTDFQTYRKEIAEKLEVKIDELIERERVVTNREKAQSEVTKVASDRLLRIETLKENIEHHKAAQATAEKKYKSAQKDIERLEATVASLLEWKRQHTPVDPAVNANASPSA